MVPKGGDASALRCVPTGKPWGSRPRRDDVQGTLPTSLRAILWGWIASGVEAGPAASLALSHVLLLPKWPFSQGPCHDGQLTAPLALMGGSMKGQPHPRGLASHTYIIDLWLRHRDPLVDSQRCVTHGHPLLLPMEEEKEPVYQGLRGQGLAPYPVESPAALPRRRRDAAAAWD